MIRTPCRFHPSVFKLVDVDFTEWIKRQVTDSTIRDRLFTYYSRPAGTFVLAEWLGEPGIGRVFQDIKILGTRPIPSRETAQHIVACLNHPLMPHEAVRQLKTGYSQSMSGLQDRQSERADQKRHATSTKVSAVVGV